MSLPGSTERQAGHDGKAELTELTNIFCAYFFSCIYFREI